MTLEQFLTANLFQYFMVFARIGGAVMLLPGYGEAYVLARARLILALMISLVALPMVVNRLPAMPERLDTLVLLLLSELAIGAFYGSIARTLLMATQSAGMIIALQIGIANALVADPITAQQGAVPGNFLLALTLFFAHAVADSIVLAIQLATPFLVYGVVFAVGLGMLARLMPSLQVFFVAAPLQLLGGTAILAVSLTTASLWFLNSYEDHLSNFLGQAR